MKKNYFVRAAFFLLFSLFFCFTVSLSAFSEGPAKPETDQSSDSGKPVASVPGGQYEGVSSLSVELTGPGTIHYTLDSSMPTSFSPVCSGPILITKTTILRARSVMPDGSSGPVATFSYFLNEHHTLPILSLVSDSSKDLTAILFSREKDIEVPAYLALYENGEEVFGKACGVQIKGNSSRTEARCSLGVYFRGKYDGKLKNCDLFDSGVTKYSSLSIREGQDWNDAIFRSELFQILCMEMSSSVPNQHTKFCVLYIDGVYDGIRCLKENVNEHFYADWADVDPDTVSIVRGPVEMEDEPFDVIHFCQTKDMSVPKNYERFCSKFDIDCLIDWAIIEGFSGNTDIMGNTKYVRSTEGDGKYRIILFDLDYAFTDLSCVFTNVLDGQGTAGVEMKNILLSLFRNPDFRDRFLTRYGELLKTTLSSEHVLSVIEDLEVQLDSEIDRNFASFHIDRADWEYSVYTVKSYITEYDVSTYSLSVLRTLIGLTPAETEKYFG